MNQSLHRPASWAFVATGAGLSADKVMLKCAPPNARRNACEARRCRFFLRLYKTGWRPLRWRRCPWCTVVFGINARTSHRELMRRFAEAGRSLISEMCDDREVMNAFALLDADVESV